MEILTPRQFQKLVELLPNILIVQDGEGNLLFPEATPEDWILINDVLATYNPEEVEQDYLNRLQNVNVFFEEGKQWFENHQNARQLFKLAMTDIENKIVSWDLSSIPNPDRDELKLTIGALVCSIRILAGQLGLID